MSFIQLDVTVAPTLAQVMVDGRELARDEWPLPLPIDPGSHTLTFAAAGQKTQVQTLTIKAPGTVRMRIEPFEAEAVVQSASVGDSTPTPATAPVPPLVATAAPPPTAPSLTPVDQPKAKSPNRTLGWILGAVGGVGLGVGAGFGIRAISLKNEADALWCTNHECTPHGVSVIDEAKLAATVATVGIVAGVIGVGAGAWFVLRPASARAQVAAIAAPDRVGLALRGSW